ncbi:MAG: D-aminoacyl-tRNA deacylase [bacterium]|nr:D-aminoacyl-tRNA deacylase [bacterium]
MRAIIQRVLEATVESNGKTQKISKGIVVFIGINKNDTETNAKYLAKKIPALRVFEDENRKMSKSLNDIKGECLLIPQFTLYGNTKDGNRPDFTEAMEKNSAQKLFDYIYDELNRQIPVKKGFFGEYMKVSVVNDGPVTIIIDA